MKRKKCGPENAVGSKSLGGSHKNLSERGTQQCLFGSIKQFIAARVG